MPDTLKWRAFVFQKTQIELGEIVETEYYMGRGKYEIVQYYDAKSNPLEADTDGDGISDDIDPHPWYKEGEWVAELSNKYLGVEYPKIVDKDGNMTHGGAQGWWSKQVQKEVDEQEDVVTDQSYPISQMGCGLIAVSDLQLYLMQQNEGYELLDQELDADLFDKNTGVIQKKDYMAYVMSGPLDFYGFRDDWLTNNFGLVPGKMKYGLNLFLSHNNHEQTSVTWAPYSLTPKTSHSMLVLEEIEDMLGKDLPVVFAYYTFDEEDKLILYSDEEYAKIQNVNADLDHEDVGEHYMTIIGLYRYLNEDSTDYEYLLKVTSWGKVHYIRYDDYIKKLSYFSNILRIE